MASSGVVLDASALLALLNDEPGSDAVVENLADAAISSVNFSEVVGKLSERGMPEGELRSALGGLGLDVRPFDTEAAYAAGLLRRATSSRGLSLGDRACVALGLALKRPVLTTDRSWAAIKVGGKIRVIR